MSALGRVHALTADLHVAHRLLDERGGQAHRRAPETGHELRTLLFLRSQPTLLLGPHPLVHHLPQSVITDVEVWAALRDVEDVDFAPRLGLLSHGRLEPSRVVVFEDVETPLRGVCCLQRLEHGALVHVRSNMRVPAGLDEMPHEHFPAPSNPGQHFDSTDATVVLHLGVGFDDPLREPLVEATIGTTATNLGNVTPTLPVQEDGEMLDVDVHLHRLQPPLTTLAHVLVCKDHPIFNILVCEGRFLHQPAEINFACVKGREDGLRAGLMTDASTPHSNEQDKTTCQRKHLKCLAGLTA
jgi:hypothetical protein